MGIVVVASTLTIYHIAKGTNMIDLCQKGFNCFLGPLGAVFVLGMFWRWAVPVTVIPAVIVGEMVGILASYSNEILGRPFSTHLVVPTAFVATIVTCQVLCALLETEASAFQQRWMWKPVTGQGRPEDPDEEGVPWNALPGENT